LAKKPAETPRTSSCERGKVGGVGGTNGHIGTGRKIAGTVGGGLIDQRA